MKISKSFLFIKRTFDIFSSSVFIIFFSWFYLLMIVINLFATKGSPIYFDKRVGKNGQVIAVPKFRTMYKNANKDIRHYLNEEQYNQWINEGKVDNDPRITKIGRFLRKTSVDELPQIFSILIGKLSVVGPRPITLKELEANYTKEEQTILLSVRPGLISNWGVNGRNLIQYKDGQRQKLELAYFENLSLKNDLKLLFKAVCVVLTRKGAQ